MKKIVLFLLVILSGCSPSDNKNESAMDQFMSNNGKVKVLSSTGIIYDLVDQIGGEYIDHLVLIAGSLDPHSYELVKGDDEKISCSQIVFYNGLGLEHGASLHYSLEHHPQGIALGNKIEKLHPEAIINIEGVRDPHIWMDVQLLELCY